LKNLIAIFILIAFCHPVHSQNRISVGVGYDVAFPVGDFADLAKTGSNWSIFAEYPINPKISFQLLSGYLIMPVDIPPIGLQGQVITFDLKSIPVKGAAKYFFYDELFVAAELGANFIKVTKQFKGSYGESSTESSNYEAKFAAGLGLGTVFHLAERSQINLIGKYIYVNGGDLKLDFSHFLIGASLVVHFDL
jgi:hypothetical protein